MKILAAIDLDELALEVLAQACAIGKAVGAEAVDAIHVESVPLRYAHLPVEQGGRVTVEEREIEAGGRRLRELIDRARDRLSLPVRPMVVGGDAAAEIVAQAERGRHDLIVLGTHRRKGVSRMLFGSVAEEVVRHAPCPLLVVPVGTSG